MQAEATRAESAPSKKGLPAVRTPARRSIPTPHLHVHLTLALPLAAMLCLLLVACGASGTPSAGAATTATTATPTATLQPTPTTAPQIATPPTSGPCASFASHPPSGGQFVQIGDLIVTAPGFGIDYPAKMLPEGTPLKPLQLASQQPGEDFTSSPPTNPSMHDSGGGYAISMCNTSQSQSHTINGVMVSFASFTPYTGQLSSWQYCDGNYSRAHGAFYGGCGGGIAFDEALHAAFAANATTGASVTATQVATGEGAGPLPVSLAPGKTLDIVIGLTVPTASGQYAFAFSLAQDGAAPALVGTTQPALFAPIAHKWTGQACTAPNMLAQIPTATDPVTYWICPES